MNIIIDRIKLHNKVLSSKNVAFLSFHFDQEEHSNKPAD